MELMIFKVLLIGLSLFLADVKKTEAVIGECGWCGMNCQMIMPDTACGDVMPPEGGECINENGVCVVKEGCESNDDCGDNQLCNSNGECQLPRCPKPPLSECQAEIPVLHACPRVENAEDGLECSVGVCQNGECVSAGTPLLICPGDTPAWNLGNVNCDENIDLLDFLVFRREFLGQASLLTDFNIDWKVDLLDFAIWRKGYLGN